MAGLELEAPEIDVDEAGDRFRRGVALAVVLVTLFGAVVAYLQSVESNDEDLAARDAQIGAIEGLGSRVDAEAALAADLRIGTRVAVARRGEAINESDDLPGGDSGTDSPASVAAQERFRAVADALAGLTVIDPANPDTFDQRVAELDERPDVRSLRQQVDAERADEHGDKADAYVAVLTVLAVSLFLLGLSLTVRGRSRFVLAAPGVAIAGVCVFWALSIAARDITKVSEVSIADAAEGRRFEVARDFDAAIEAYDRAIEDSPDFAAAYARRAGARFDAGSPQVGQTAFTSITSDDALEAALEDIETALDLGAGNDIITVAQAGFFTFLDGDFERSIELSRQATELNPNLAQIWFNLGVAHVARGDEDGAEDAYDEGFRVLEDAFDSNILAGARTDLSVLREILDDDELDEVIDLVVETEAALADFELSVRCPDCAGPDGARDAELGEAFFSRTGEDVTAEVPIDGLDEGDTVAAAWYFRTDDSLPFEQAAESFKFATVTDGVVTVATQPSLDPPCPVAGEYLVRLYAGGEFIGEAQDTIEQSVLGGGFTLFSDPVEGVNLCVPEDFEPQRQEDATGFDFVSMTAPDGSLVIGANVVRGVEAGAGQVDTLVSGVGPPEAINLFGFDLEDNLVTIEGLFAISDAGDEGLAAALGPDDSFRLILLTGSGITEEELFEAVGLVTFTGLDVPAE